MTSRDAEDVARVADAPAVDVAAAAVAAADVAAADVAAGAGELAGRRIAIDARSIGTVETGPGIYTRQLVERLSRLCPAATFHLYWAKREPGTIPPGGANVVTRDLGRPVGRRAGNLLFEQVLLPRAIVRDGCDLLWSPVFVLPLWKDRPHVVTMHDVIPLVFAREATLARRAVYHTLLRVSARRADLVLTVSQASARDLESRLAVPRERIEAIPNGCEPIFRPLGAHEEPALQHCLRDLGIRRPYFLSTAGLLPRKNAHGILEAFARAFGAGSRAPAPSLVLTGRIGAGGNGEYVEELRRRSRMHGIEERVRFPGFLSREQIRLLYGGALASVDASFYEGFGFPVLESMACGCPVLGSNASSLPEVGGEALLRFDPASIEEIAAALERIAGDAGLRRSMTAAGLARAGRFEWEESARAVAAAFARVLAGRVPSIETSERRRVA
ncbi:MAG: glycosyltransferase family 4 protein [Candidatus Eisenbacteria bacterium]